jgi:hypothetical protein
MYRILSMLGALLLVSGCASRGTVSQSSRLADAGIAYGAAAAEVVPLTRDRYLAWSSASLVDESQDVVHCTAAELAGETALSAACTELSDEFDAAYASYAGFVDSMAALQSHALALSGYFRELKALADYDSNAAAAGAAGRLIERINGLSAVLEPEAGLSDAQKSAWSKMAGLVGDAIKAQRLRARLQADAHDIARAIDIQDGVLEASIAVIAALDRAQRELAYQRDVRAAYLRGEIKDVAKWQAALRGTLLPGPVVAPLQALQKASEGLQSVWNDLLTGQGSAASAQDVLEDTASALKAIDDVRRANAAKTDGE